MEKEANKDSYRHILKYIGLFGGVQGLIVLVGILRNKLVAMLLGPSGVGLNSLFLSTLQFVSNSTSFGIATSAVRNISEAYDQGDVKRLEREVTLVRSWSLLAAVLGMMLCIVFSPLLSWFTFSWNGHTLHFIFLSPAIALLAIINGEMSILKGIRKLRQLATISVYHVFGALIFTTPLFYFFRSQAIVPSLVLVLFIQFLLTINVSYRHYRPRFSFRWSILSEGGKMIRLGLAFVIAGMLGSGADFLIRSYLNNVASIEMVGFYNAAYMMTIVYAGMIFSAMETDYFPRLSGVNKLRFSFNHTINRQAEISLLLVSPLLAFFLMILPFVVQLLYSRHFLPVVPMAQVMILAMYFRAVRLPVEYIPLAKGDSRSFLFLESVYDIAVVLLVVGCYEQWGLRGAGIGISATGLLHLLVVYGYARLHYHYCPSRSLVYSFLLQLALGSLVFVCVQQDDYWGRWVVSGILSLCSLLFSLFMIKQRVQRKKNRE